MIFYTPHLPVGGIAIAPRLVLINADQRYNKPLHVHELVHVQQQKTLGVFKFWWRYLTNATFRQSVEVEAYRAQIAAGASLSSCAHNLATMYRLDLDYGAACALLQDHAA